MLITQEHIEKNPEIFGYTTLCNEIRIEKNLRIELPNVQQIDGVLIISQGATVVLENTTHIKGVELHKDSVLVAPNLLHVGKLIDTGSDLKILNLQTAGKISVMGEKELSIENLEEADEIRAYDGGVLKLPKLRKLRKLLCFYNSTIHTESLKEIECLEVRDFGCVRATNLGKVGSMHEGKSVKKHVPQLTEVQQYYLDNKRVY